MGKHREDRIENGLFIKSAILSQDIVIIGAFDTTTAHCFKNKIPEQPRVGPKDLSCF